MMFLLACRNVAGQDKEEEDKANNNVWAKTGGPRDTIVQDQLKNQRYIIRFGHKKLPHLGRNSRPGESDP